MITKLFSMSHLRIARQVESSIHYVKKKKVRGIIRHVEDTLTRKQHVCSMYSQTMIAERWLRTIAAAD
jgi:hypothetical protein